MIIDDERVTHYNKIELTEEKYKNMFNKVLTDNRELTNLVNIDECWYYQKPLKETKIINELIGSYLAKILNLDTVEYILGKNNIDKDYTVLSKYFKSMEKEYLEAEDFVDKTVNGYINFPLFQTDLYCKTEYLKQLNVNQRKKVLKVTMLDLYMSQIDRNSSNLLFEKKDENITLSKVFDYASSFSKMKCYFNPFVELNVEEKSIYRLIMDYPESYMYLYDLVNNDIENVLNLIEENYPIKIDANLKKQYIESDSIKIFKKLK